MTENRKLNLIKHILTGVGVMLALLMMLFFIKINFVDGAPEKSKGYYINDVYDGPSRALVHGQTVEQEFSAAGSIYGMTVRFHNAAQPQKGNLHIQLINKNDMTVVAQGNANTETLVNDGYSALIFDRPYSNASGRQQSFILRLTPEFENENAFMRIWEDVDTQTIGFGVISQRPAAAAVNRYFYTMAFVTIVAVAVIYLLCFVVRPRKEFIFAVAYLCTSLLVTIALPPYSSPDEEAHFNSAYTLANRIEGYSRQELADKTIYSRAEDHNSLFEDKYTTVFTYEYINDNFFSKSEDNTVVSHSGNWLVRDFNGVYTMGALGILTGKALNLGYVPMMYLGRFFNLMLFTICVFMAIKITPVGKECFMVLSFLPITMHITNSFSRDTFVISLGFLFTAYLLSLLHQKEKYRLWQLALLALICVLLAPSKFIYSVMCVLVLLLNKDKFNIKAVNSSGKKPVIKIIAGFTAVAAVILAVMYKTSSSVFRSVFNSFKASVPLEVLMQTNPQATFNIGIILSNPVVFLKLVLNTIYQNGAYYVKSIAGGVLGYNSIRISDAFIFVLLALAIISTCSVPDDRYRLRTRDRIGFIGVFCLVAALVVYVAVTWTPVVDTTIYGIQGKYLMPALPLLLIACKNKIFVAQKDIFSGLCFASALTTICVAWNAFAVIMQR